MVAAAKEDCPEAFERPTLEQRNWVLAALRDETTGGILLLLAAVIALVWANSPWGDAYQALSQYTIGPESLHLNLSLETWAADGLLAFFFYIAGVELKHELVLGTLSKPSVAAVPVMAALGGMVVPATLYFLVNSSSSVGEPQGWGIPMATDIAFALAVLAVLGSRLPLALRAFLLTMAVVDDLGAIIVIAIFYSKGFHLMGLVLAILCLVVFALAMNRRITTAWLYAPLALATWYFVHESGIHATVAGVALGLLTRVKPDPGEAQSPGDRVEFRLRPFSAAICVPLFAFFSAGVDLRGTGLGSALASPIAIGIMVGLVLGKPLGVVGGAWLTTRFTRGELNKDLEWRDVMTIGLLGGIGFTVSLLISELAFADTQLSEAKVGVLAASCLAALLAGIAIRGRHRHYKALDDYEEADADNDGIPDVYQGIESESEGGSLPSAEQPERTDGADNGSHSSGDTDHDGGK